MADTVKQVADLIGDQWMDLGAHLGVAVKDLKDGNAEQMLQVWMQKRPNEEQRTEMVSALEKMQRHDIATAIGLKETPVLDEDEGYEAPTASTSATRPALWDRDNPHQQQLVIKSPEHHKMLLKQRVLLTNIIHIEPLLPYLQQLGVIDVFNEEEIKSHASSVEQVLALLDHIERGPMWMLHALCRASILSHQQYIVHIIGMNPAAYIGTHWPPIIKDHVSTSRTRPAVWDKENPQQQSLQPQSPQSIDIKGHFQHDVFDESTKEKMQATSDTVKRVADLIGNQWMDLGAHLGVAVKDLKDGNAEQMLQVWMQKRPNEEQRAKLITALEKMQRHDIATTIAAEGQKEDSGSKTPHAAIEQGYDARAVCKDVSPLPGKEPDQLRDSMDSLSDLIQKKTHLLEQSNDEFPEPAGPEDQDTDYYQADSMLQEGENIETVNEMDSKMQQKIKELDEPSEESGASASNKVMPSHPCHLDRVHTSCSYAVSPPDMEVELRPEDYHDMPLQLRVPNADVFLITCEEDKYDGKRLKDLMEQVEYTTHDGETTKCCKVYLWDDMDHKSSIFDCITEAQDLCSYVFILLTKNFCGNKFGDFQRDDSIVRCVTTQTRRWGIVPLYTQPKRGGPEDKTCVIPNGLMSFKGLDMSRLLKDRDNIEELDSLQDGDNYFQRGLISMLEARAHERIKREEQRLKERYLWIERKKREILVEQNRMRLEMDGKNHSVQQKLTNLPKELLLSQSSPVDFSQALGPTSTVAAQEPYLAILPDDIELGCNLRMSECATSSPVITMEPPVLTRRERLAKSRGLRNHLHDFLLSLGHSSGIDMDDQKVTIYCLADDVEAVEQGIQEQLKSVDTELHGYYKVVGAEFCVVRDQSGVGAGCTIQYEDMAGKRSNVTFGGLLKNLTNNKIYIMTTTHLCGAVGRPFYYMTPTGEEVPLGHGVAFVQQRDPLIEACLVEVLPAVVNRCNPCLSKSNLEIPAIFGVLYTGPDEDLVPVEDGDLPTEVFMCTASMKRGRVKVIDFVFRDPDTDPRDKVMITGGMVTVPVDDDDLSVSGHSGAFIGLASAQSFTVDDWCLSTRTSDEATSVKQLAGGDNTTSTLHRSALPMGEPSSSMQTTTHVEEPSHANLGPDVDVGSPVMSPDIQHPNPQRYINVESSPASLTVVPEPEACSFCATADVRGQRPPESRSLVDRFIMGGASDGAIDGATGGAVHHDVSGAMSSAPTGAHCNNGVGLMSGAPTGAHCNNGVGLMSGAASDALSPTSVQPESCSWRQAEEASSHKAISMHCFGGPFPGHPERGSVSFRLDRTIKAFEKQLKTKLTLIPLLRSEHED